MRPAIRAENPLEWLLLRLGLLPTPLLDGYWGMATSRALLTAIELGLFDVLRERPMTAVELAERLGTDLSGTEVLLGALNGMRYVRRRAGRYSNGREVTRWLSESGTLDLRESVLFFGDLWDVVSDLTGLVRSGNAGNLHYDGRGPDFWRRYLRGLGVFVPLAAPEIVRKARLPRGARRLLDVGGGHGLYAAGFVRRTPGLSAEVFDLPEACAVGREMVAESGVAEGVTFREGDARSEPWGEGFDAVLLFNLVHNLTPEESADAFRRAHAALRPGGVVVVLEGEHQGAEGDISITAGLNEMLFFLTSGTRVYPEATMRDWMSDAGFSGIRTRHLISMPMMVLITATR
ncbi:MAG: class I SAM-dependent methyltransferase [Coriobacteriaceae bacterium]|nr:class I SAM-dependent methyltransferase [Coriobacteriaceae bacterium]